MKVKSFLQKVLETKIFFEETEMGILQIHLFWIVDLLLYLYQQLYCYIFKLDKSLL